MKTSKMFLIIISLIISFSLLAQDPNVILQREISGELTIGVGLAVAGNIEVDWGDGNKVTAAAGTTNSTQNITGNVTGTNTIKLYGPITSLLVTKSDFSTRLTSVDVSNNPTLVKLTVPRNKLTSLDLSNNPALNYISIYNNSFTACALDYLYQSMPTITWSGSITLYNNSGALTSKTSIPVSKGWTIGSGTVGDGTGCPATSETPNITFNTETTGGTIDISVGLAATGDIQVDWGDGTRLTQTVGTTTSPTTFSGTISGSIKLYGAITSFAANDANMVSADVSNAPNLIRFIGVRNKMTALDLSANPNVTTVSIHTNLFSACALDALFTSLPTVSTGSITFYNNAGAATSKTSIATNKGWTLAGGSLPGDGTGCISTNLLNSNMLTKASVTYSDQELKIMHSGISGSATLSVYNVSGKLVLQKNTTFEEGTCIVRTPSLYSGIYLLKIVGDQHEISEKLLISK